MSFLLLSHIAGAILAGLVAVGVCVGLYTHSSRLYLMAGIILGLLIAFEIATGTVLAILSTEKTALELALHVVGYLSVFVALEIALYTRVKLRNPAQYIAVAVTPVALSTILYINTIYLGL